MKSVSVAAALLASVAVAQPHGHNHHRRHHDRRALKVEWETVYETVTVVVDDHSTETIYPSASATPSSSNTPGQFFQSLTTSSSLSTPTTTSTTSTSAAAPTTLVAQSPSSTAETPAAAPTTSTTPVVVQSPTTTPEAPVVQSTTTAAAPAPASTTSTSAGSTGGSSGGSSGANSKSGEMTYYTVGPGSCGYDDTGADTTKNIVAMGHEFWNSISTLTSYGVNQPANPLCDQEITISINGKTAVGVIRDMCPGCSGDGIDVSEALFTQLVGSTTAGRVDVSWYFNSGKW